MSAAANATLLPGLSQPFVAADVGGTHVRIGLVQAGATADATDTACEIVRPILVERQSTAAASSARFNKG